MMRLKYLQTIGLAVIRESDKCCQFVSYDFSFLCFYYPQYINVEIIQAVVVGIRGDNQARTSRQVNHIAGVYTWFIENKMLPHLIEEG